MSVGKWAGDPPESDSGAPSGPGKGIGGSRLTPGEAARPLCRGTSMRKTKEYQPRDPGRPKTHTHTEQEGNRKGAKPSMPRQGSFHSLPHTQIHYTYYYRFESCGGPRSLFLYICLLQLLFSITAGPIYILRRLTPRRICMTNIN